MRLASGGTELILSDVCKNCADGSSDLQVIQCNASNVHGYAFGDGYINVLGEEDEQYILNYCLQIHIEYVSVRTQKTENTNNSCQQFKAGHKIRWMCSLRLSTLSASCSTDQLIIAGFDSQLCSVIGQSAERPGFDSWRRKSVGHRWNL